MKTAFCVSSGKSNRSSRKGGTVFPYLLLIALGAFAIRFAVSCELVWNDPAVLSPSSITDMRTYLDLADGILKGKLPRNFYYQPFYYAVFLPLCRLAGPVWPLVLVQSVIGGLSVWFCGLCAQFSAGRKAGIWAALLAAFCSVSIYFTPYALLEVLQGFWIVLLLFLTLRLYRNVSSWRLWMSVGLVLGCSILTRGNCWFFLPVLLWVAFRKTCWKKFLLRAGLLLGVAMLPQLPFMAYNTFQNGYFCGPSTAGGAVLAFGNNPEGAPAGLEIPYPKTYELWLSKEREISVPRRIWQWFKEEPAAFLEQQFQKCMLFWDAADYPNNITEQNAQKSSLMRTVRFLPTGIILMLGLAGLFNGFFRGYFWKRKSFLLTGSFIVLYALSISAFYLLGRFRVPVLPLTAASGGVFLSLLLRHQPFGMRVRRIGFGALAAFAVYGFMPLYSYVYEPSVAAVVRPGGVQTEFETCPYEWPHRPCGPYLLMTDHSSVLKGGWSGIGNHFTVTKTFEPKILPRGNRALLVLPVFGEEGSATLTVNGERQRVMLRNRLLAADVPLQAENGKIVLNIMLSEPFGEWTCAMDARRDYGRTVLNHRKVPYELVCFLILPVQSGSRCSKTVK